MEMDQNEIVTMILALEAEDISFDKLIMYLIYLFFL